MKNISKQITENPNPETAGVICEFDPFHNGHLRLFSEIRSSIGPDGILVCVMSGPYVQRGEFCLFPPHVRAEMALAAGADCVVECPFPWSCAGAEQFARAGVKILGSLGAKSLWFGSECGRPELLTSAAKVVSDPGFIAEYTALTKNAGTAEAYRSLLQQRIKEMPSFPQIENPAGFPESNDTLGIQYVRAIGHFGSDIRPRSVLRVGQAYSDTTWQGGKAPSATAIRQLITRYINDPDTLAEKLTESVPGCVYGILSRYLSGIPGPIDPESFVTDAFTLFRLSPAYTRDTFAETGGGLMERMRDRARTSSTPEAFLRALGGNVYTTSRVKRGLLYSLTSVTERDMNVDDNLIYYRLLGVNPKGRSLLRRLSEVAKNAPTDTGVIKPVTKFADAPEGRQKELAAVSDSLYCMHLPVPVPAGSYLKMSPVLYD